MHPRHKGYTWVDADGIRFRQLPSKATMGTKKTSLLPNHI